MTPRRTIGFISLGLILLTLIIVSLGVGAVPLTPGQVIAALSGNATAAHEAIVWDFRLARILIVCLCGMALAAAGVGFQGLFRNPLADPFIVGASSGAALGAVISVLLSARLGQTIPIGLAGFVGAIVAVFIVYGLAETSSYGSIAGLLLAGAALSTMLSALVSLVLLLNDRVMQEVFAWMLGGFSGRSWPHLRQIVFIVPLGTGILWLMSRPLDALAAGEESAATLGLNVRQTRFIIIIGASLLTASAVAAGGIIGFVGLIAPHLMRPVFGAGHRALLPAAMLTGSILLLTADNLARTLMSPLELPVGVFTALLGGGFFLFLLHKGRV
jgi:iron complex transport system permease protein